VEDAPVVAGIQAADPRFWDMSYFIDKFISAGFSGIINFPTMGLHEPGTMWRELYEKVNLGIGREVEAIRVAREKDLFTMAYVFRPDEGAAMVEAGLDCIVPHVGGTAGGMTGFGATPHEQAAKVAQEIIVEAKKINPDIICLAHGGPFAGPEDTKYLYEHTDAVGFVGASSIERIPIERAIVEELKKFKSYKIGK
jgi:predicted TIM-barrel enzyme